MSNATPIDVLYDVDQEILALENQLKAKKTERAKALSFAQAHLTNTQSDTGVYSRLRRQEKMATKTDWKALVSTMGATDEQIKGVTKTSTSIEYVTEKFDPDSVEKAKLATYAVIDTETTGMDKHDQIIELSATRLQGGKVTGAKTWRCKPTVPINPDAERIHGISIEQLDDCPPFEDILTDFIEFIEDAILVAHNAPFDQRMLQQDLDRVNAGFDIEIEVCTLAMFRAVKAKGPHKLPDLLGFYGMAGRKGELHGAAEDTQLLAMAFPLLQADFDAKTRIAA